MILRQLISIAFTALLLHADSIGANGVITFTDPNVNVLLGPMIAYGSNPWGYADERERRTVDLQVSGPTANNYATSSAGAGQWKVSGAGTIAYKMRGIGPLFGQTAGTTLSAGISATDLSIPINDARLLPGLQTLPTAIIINGQELIRISVCTSVATGMDCTGATVAATLTVPFNGRGISDVGNSTIHYIAAAMWAINTGVGEYRIQGTGTSFGTDANRPVCPAGLPGPPGAVVYSTGTVHLTAGSTAITLSGGSWSGIDLDSNSNFITTDSIRINAPTHGGVAFDFWANFTFTSATAGTLTRAFPGAADTGDYTYKIVTQRYVSLEFADIGAYPHVNGTYRHLADVKYCENETSMHGAYKYSFDSWLGSYTQSAVKYSYKDALGAQSAFGPNFYGTGLAAYTHYRATLGTYASAETLSNGIDNYYVGDPEMGGGWGIQASPLLVGGGVIGGFIKLILDPTTTLTWGDVRGWAEAGYHATYYGAATTNCNASDTRNNAYSHAWLALAALYDTDPSWKAYWVAGLQAELTRDLTCRRATYTGTLAYSFANSALWPDSYIGNPALTLDGSNIGVASGGLLATNLCNGNFIGTVQVTNNSTAATRISTVSGALGNTTSDIRIWITDGAGYTGSFQYSASGANITLAGVWAGQTGTFNALAETTTSERMMTAIGNGSVFPTEDTLANNTQLTKSYGCKVLDDTHVQFDRPVGISGSGYHIGTAIIAGMAQQPYMYGIKTRAVKWSCAVNDPTIQAGYCPMLAPMGTWMYTYGYDPFTFGTYYGRGGTENLCEPQGTPDPLGGFRTVHGWSLAQSAPCGYSGLAGTTGGEYDSRVATAEAMAAYIEYYLANPNATIRAQIDKVYGALYGKCSLAISVYCDAHYVNEANELYDGSIGAYKWPGFFFGMGMARQWPAIRVMDLSPRTPAIGSLIRVGSGIRF